MAVECPNCGSCEISIEQKVKQVTVPFHAPVAYKATQHLCKACNESGDFTGENDSVIMKIREEAIKESVLEMLSDLAARGIKMTYIERALRLPSKTINRWKTGDTSAAAVALLRIVRTLPWVLDVADHGYHPDAVRAKIFDEAARIIEEQAQKHYSGCTVNKFEGEGSNMVQFEFHLKEPMPIPSFSWFGGEICANR